jgi:Golgi phosphoprotein 3
MSGLQRRRVGHASESSVGGAQAGTFTMDPDSSSPTNGDAHRGHGGSALEGGGRVAYDPRDLEFSNEAKEGGKMPRLTIMEEVLLLGLKDRAVCVRFLRHSILLLIYAIGLGNSYHTVYGCPLP